jgi:hypothetical protein
MKGVKAMTIHAVLALACAGMADAQSLAKNAPASAPAADFTWTFGPPVNVSHLAYGDGIDENPGNAFYKGNMYFFENRYAASAHIWKGTNMDSLAYQYQAVCDKTFPVYVGDLGCWFAGLWIDPDTGDFYSSVHHEFNKLATPGFVESRRVGIAKSTDQGRNWTYLGDCLSSPNDDMKGPEYWKGDAVDAGCGDQHLFVDTKSGYFYLYYVNKYFYKSRKSNEHKMKVARCKISDMMAPGKWFKFYNGAWTEPGMGGKGSWLDKLHQFPDVKYSTYLGKYIAIGHAAKGMFGIQICTSMETQDWTNVENLGAFSPMTWGYPLLTDDANQADNGQVDQTMRIYFGSCAPAKCYYWPVTLGTGVSKKSVGFDYRSFVKDENMYFEPNPMLNWNYPGKIAYGSKSLNYVGTWTNSFHYDDDSGGTKYSESAGDSVELSFPGDSVIVRVRKAPDAGLCDIYLDDLVTPVATGVDTYCATNAHAQAIFAKNGLAQSNHLVKIVIKGARNPSSSGNRIYLDSITFTKATPAYDCPDTPTGVSAVTHSNGIGLAWNRVMGASSYNVYRTTHSNGVSNLRMIKKGAVGTGYVDASAAVRKDYYYRVTVVDPDGKESLRSATVRASWNAPGWITVNDNGPGVSYSPGWSLWTKDPEGALIGGDLHYSSVTNAFVEFAFTGTGVSFIADTAANHGRCDVYLDGGLVARNIDLYADPGVTRYEAFRTNGLPDGPHTLKVVVTGSRNDRASGCQIDVDAFEYFKGGESEGAKGR